MTWIADWYLNQIATHGAWTVLGVHAAGFLAGYGAAGALVDWQAARRKRRRDIRRLESFANHPAHRTRKEDRP